MLFDIKTVWKVRWDERFQLKRQDVIPSFNSIDNVGFHCLLFSVASVMTHPISIKLNNVIYLSISGK